MYPRCLGHQSIRIVISISGYLSWQSRGYYLLTTSTGIFGPYLDGFWDYCLNRWEFLHVPSWIHLQTDVCNICLAGEYILFRGVYIMYSWIICWTVTFSTSLRRFQCSIIWLYNLRSCWAFGITSLLGAHRIFTLILITSVSAISLGKRASRKAIWVQSKALYYSNSKFKQSYFC